MSECYWLLVTVDRHRDDEFALFRTPEEALVAAQEFAKEYGERIVWQRRASKDSDRWGSLGSDDGPRCRIVKMSLHVEEAERE